MSTTFESYSQNREDVVLWRALHGVEDGRYIEVGANDPHIFSMTMGFYSQGWNGITIEPDPEFAQMQRDARPRDLVVEAAVTAKDGDRVTFHVVDGTGLSTLRGQFAEAHASSGFDTHDIEVTTRRVDSILEEAGWNGHDIHFMSVDTEGAEREVLESVDFDVWRPWVLIVEATEPLSTTSTREAWEPLLLGAGYRFCFFDGLSCFYVAEERAAALGGALSYPACSLDDYTTREIRELETTRREIPLLVEDVSRWRVQALNRWATAVANATAVSELSRVSAELARLRGEHHDLHQMHHKMYLEMIETNRYIQELHESTSWRVTKPLRRASEVLRHPQTPE